MNINRLMIAMLVLFAGASAAMADEIRLRPEAKVAGERVTLGDVAEITGAQASHLSAVVLSDFAGKASEMTLSVDQVRDRLAEERVNLGRVTLTGPMRCRVTRASAAIQQPVAAPAAEPVTTQVLSNPREAVTLNSPQTIRDAAIDTIVKLSGFERDDLRIQFSDRDAKLLTTPLAGQRFEFEPGSATGLGRVPLVVRKWNGEKLVDMGRLSADVSRRVLALVTVKAVSRGEAFTRDDVEVREVYLQDGKAEPLTEPEQVAGRESIAQLKVGSVVLASNVRSPVVVRRNELITVQCVAGALVIRMQARAMEDGVMDETIRLKSDKSPETFAAKVTGVRQAVVVTGDTPAVASANTEQGKKQ